MKLKKDQIASGNRLSYYDSMYVYAGGAADEIILGYWSEMHVLSGGTATATHVSYGDLRVSSGGDVSNTEVKDGEMFILSGGVAENTVLNGNASGRIYVSSGGTANTVNMAYGAMHIAQGGAVTDLTLNGGTLYVSSGGTAENIVWTPCSGYIAAEWGAQVTYASDFTGVYYGSDNTQSMSDVQVNRVMYVMSDGVVSKGTVGSGGNDIFCFSGDFGIDTVTQLDGGSVTLYFDSEDVQWDEETNSCTDGKNSVTLNGDFEFTVFYETPDELVSVGAFEDFTSEKIFEEKTLVA